MVPLLVNFSGRAVDAQGKAISGVAGLTFAIYGAQQGGAPLWIETQNVTTDARGNYTVQLGSTQAGGLSLKLFSSGEARWVGVRVNGADEQPRVLVVSVPYALKAADAQTLGGLPASAFVLAAPHDAKGGSAASGEPLQGSDRTGSSDVTTAGGTTGTIPFFKTATDIENSALTQTGSGTSAKVGVNNPSPSATLDVKGNSMVRGTLSLPPTKSATSTQGYDSQPIKQTASSYDSGVGAAVAQNFLWQAEPINNDTGNASGTLNLLFATGSNTPSETGLHIATNGQVTFAKGQTFPGTGDGTVTSVASGAGLTGGPITKSGSLSIASGGVTNAMLQNPSLTVTANSPLSGGGSVALGGSTSLGLKSCSSNQILEFTGGAWTCVAIPVGTISGVTAGTGLTGGGSSGNVTLNIDTTKVPQLAANNTFTGSQVAEVSGGQAMVASSSGSGNAGLLAIESATSGGSLGVWATTQDPTGAGVYGVDIQSSSGRNQGFGAGVWGDTGVSLDTAVVTGVLGTADDAIAGTFINNSDGADTLQTINRSSNGYPFRAFNSANNAGCSVNQSGELLCNGGENAVVPLDGGKRKVALSAIESPQNWFEDFGSAQLVNGVAVVRLDPDFIQAVNSEKEYRVFPVPNGDCKGLYVTNKSPESFEVRELGGGTSNIRFDYRITAIRRKYETVRFADHTNDPDPAKMLKKMRESSVKNSAAVMARPALTATAPQHEAKR
ncbi:MAG TPA: hypothetical protein VF753_02910 [Terriglobales bacterium]